MKGVHSELRSVLIAPDATLSRAFVASASAASEIVLVASESAYATGTELAALLDQHAPDALLIDVASDRNAALGLVAAALEERPHLAVVALARSNDPEAILQCLRSGAAEFLAAPFPDADLRQAVRRMMGRRNVESEQAPLRRGRLLAFAPVKGGSGSTTIALNTALQIRKLTSGEVLLADLNLAAGVVGFLLRLKTSYTVIDALKHSGQLDRSLWKSLVVEYEGVDILPAPERPEPSLIEPYPVQEVLDFARTIYDWVVVDLGSLCEGAALAVASSADQVNLVCTTDMTSLFLMRRMIPLLEELGRRRDNINVLVNRVDRHSELSVGDMEKIFRASVHATFADDPAAVSRAQREGAALGEGSDLARNIKRFVQQTTGAADNRQERAFGSSLRQLWGGT